MTEADGARRRGWGRYSAAEIDAAVIRHGGLHRAAAALGVSPNSLVSQLHREFGIVGSGFVHARATLRRLVERLGLEAAWRPRP